MTQEAKKKISRLHQILDETPQISSTICRTRWNNLWMPKLTTLRNQRNWGYCNGEVYLVCNGVRMPFTWMPGPKVYSQITAFQWNHECYSLLEQEAEFTSSHVAMSVCLLKEKETCQNGCNSVWDPEFWSFWDVSQRVEPQCDGKVEEFQSLVRRVGMLLFSNQPWCLCRSSLQHQSNIPLSFFNVLHTFKKKERQQSLQCDTKTLQTK